MSDKNAHHAVLHSQKKAPQISDALHVVTASNDATGVENRVSPIHVQNAVLGVHKRWETSH